MADAWPAIREAFGRIRRFAAVMANKPNLNAAGVRRQFDGLLASVKRHGRSRGGLAVAFAHFTKATRSYRPHLFACYDVAGLPRTNNDLEQFFGSYRYHERRCSGRKVGSPGTVVRGSVQLVTAAATRAKAVEPADLAPADLDPWRALRASLERRRAVRTLGRRFRRDPDAYLQSLEDALINRALPSWLFCEPDRHTQVDPNLLRSIQPTRATLRTGDSQSAITRPVGQSVAHHP
jgi:hypothetical protein